MKNLSKLEKECYLIILDLGREICFKSIYELSDIMNCSPATINRTIKKMGYENLKHYKKSLQLTESINDDFNSINLNALQQEYTGIRELSRLILNSKKIHIISLHKSGSYSIELCDELNKIGFNSLYYNSADYLYNRAKVLFDINDLLIIMTYSGKDDFLKHIAQTYNTITDVVLVTGTINTAITDHCAYVINLECYHDNGFENRIPFSIFNYQLINILSNQTFN